MTAEWRKVRGEDARALRDWLSSREEYACGFAWRVFGEPSSVPVLGTGAAVYARFEGGAISGAVLFARGGMVFPVLDGKADADAARTFGRFLGLRAEAPSSVTGREADVVAFESLARLRPALPVRYLTMSIDAAGASRAAAPAAAPARVRRALPSDLPALVPLQADYEREEVLTSMHLFDPRASEAGLVHSLASQRVWLAEVGGRPVAKAQTNARGIRLEQAGGIYVVPELRGRGLGRAVVAALLADIASAGKGATLFVKQGNAAARGLYRALGLEELGPFRIDYMNP